MNPALAPLEDSSPPSLLVVSEPLEPSLELSPVVVVDCFAAVEVVEVEVVWAAAFSMLVSVGGMMSGVLLGTASDTLVPPQPPSASPPSRATRAITGAP